MYITGEFIYSLFRCFDDEQSLKWKSRGGGTVIYIFYTRRMNLLLVRRCLLFTAGVEERGLDTQLAAWSGRIIASPADVTQPVHGPCSAPGDWATFRSEEDRTSSGRLQRQVTWWWCGWTGSGWESDVRRQTGTDEGTNVSATGQRRAPAVSCRDSVSV